MSVRPSVRMEHIGSLWTDFHELCYLKFYQKSVEKIQVSLKSDNSNGHFTSRRCHIYDKMLQAKVVEKIKIHFILNIFFPSENRTVYEVMWKNMAEPERPQMTIYNTAHALSMLCD